MRGVCSPWFQHFLLCIFDNVVKKRGAQTWVAATSEMSSSADDEFWKSLETRLDLATTSGRPANPPSTSSAGTAAGAMEDEPTK